MLNEGIAQLSAPFVRDRQLYLTRLTDALAQPGKQRDRRRLLPNPTVGFCYKCVLWVDCAGIIGWLSVSWRLLWWQLRCGCWRYWAPLPRRS